MCYLIAKRFQEEGCLALQTEYGPTLSALVTYLGRKTFDKGIQILTVSNREVYGEYEPYHMVSTESEFIQKVLEM